MPEGSAFQQVDIIGQDLSMWSILERAAVEMGVAAMDTLATTASLWKEKRTDHAFLALRFFLAVVLKSQRSYCLI